MKMVFIAGPYRGTSEFAVEENIRRAESLAIKVWLAGAACVCPHKNTSRFGGAAPDEVWLEGAKEMVRRSDAVLCTNDWKRSSGAKGEVDLANSIGIPVFERIEDLREWLNQEFQSQKGG